MSTLGSLSVKLGLNPSQFRDGLALARGELAAFKTSTDDSSKSSTSLKKVVDDLGKSVSDAALSVVKGASAIGGYASAALSVVPYIAKAATATDNFVVAAVKASPALIAIAGSLLLVKSVITALAPAIEKAFTPLTAALKTATDNASKLATAGLTPLINKFDQLNMPAISSMMNGIATSTNGVVKGMLAWGNSTAGVMAIRNITMSTSDAFASLAPHIQAVLVALGNMLGRITAVSTAAGASGLGGVLDKLTAWMDKVNAATVLSGLDKLKSDYSAVVGAITTFVGWLKTAYGFYQQNITAIHNLQDGLSVLAIIFGGPIAAAVAIVGLLARNWQQFGTASTFLGPLATAISNLLQALSPLVPVIGELIAGFAAGLLPVILAITPIVQLLANVIAWLGPGLGVIVAVAIPLVAALKAWAIIQGVLNIVMMANPIGLIIVAIIALIAIVAAIVIGVKALIDNWSSVWSGIKSIVGGAVDWIKGVLGWFGGLGGMFAGWFGSAINAVGGAIGGLIGMVAGIPGAVISAIGDLGSLLYNAGKSVIQGLINGIKGMLGSLGSAASSVASTIASYLPFSPAKTGPLSGMGSPQISGSKIATMVAQGMLSQLPTVSGASQQLASAAAPNTYPNMPAGLVRAAGQDSTPMLQLGSDGSKVGDLLLEVLSKAARGKGLQVVTAR
ncbi:MAG: phage tail protein [Pseudonocardiaceae bacterium]